MGLFTALTERSFEVRDDVTGEILITLTTEELMILQQAVRKRVSDGDCFATFKYDSLLKKLKTAIDKL